MYKYILYIYVGVSCRSSPAAYNPPAIMPPHTNTHAFLHTDIKHAQTRRACLAVSVPPESGLLRAAFYVFCCCWCCCAGVAVVADVFARMLIQFMLRLHNTEAAATVAESAAVAHCIGHSPLLLFAQVLRVLVRPLSSSSTRACRTKRATEYSTPTQQCSCHAQASARALREIELYIYRLFCIYCSILYKCRYRGVNVGISARSASRGGIAFA